MKLKLLKKSIIVEGIKFDGTNESEILQFIKGQGGLAYHPTSKDIIIETLEGNMTANIGDYIIRGAMGEFYPVKEEVFSQTFEIISFEDDVELTDQNIIVRLKSVQERLIGDQFNFLSNEARIVEASAILLFIVDDIEERIKNGKVANYGKI